MVASKSLVLAGGGGVRLRPLTLSAPKHLIPLLDRAMIEYPIQHLVDAGVRDGRVVKLVEKSRTYRVRNPF